ncbi:transmembrane protein 79-like [Zootoca vivipara]|uniref:transmembrane protein 79-like n=1 Tax=Zootoca vivipara TaxID=8524 RepID=UPI00293BC048|nr:transmembrane protein 79-like [Zootoca vivipara]
MATTRSPASPRQLKEFDSVRDSLADIIGQLRDIDPSHLSFSPFLDLDTQISLAPVSDSPESSLEELHSTEAEEEEEEEGAAQAPEGSDVGLPPMAGADTVATRLPKETSFLDSVHVVPRFPLPHPEQRSEGGQTGTLTPTDWPPHECQPWLEAGDSACPVLRHGSGELTSCVGGSRGCRACSGSEHMKAVASAFVALLLAPWFLYVTYYFLPLPALACPDLASRVALALRCLPVAGLPILLGIVLRAFSALCLDNLGPLGTRSRPALLHQLFVAGSVDQLSVFALNVVVTATFLPQEHLRLIPILVGLFAVGRCCYWACLHLCSTYRGFGFGLSFFPTVGMSIYNLFCLYHLGLGFLFAALPDIRNTSAPALELTMPKR